MIYDTYSIGGVLYHADRANHKYIKKVKTKNGKWRYIYNLGRQWAADVDAFGNKAYANQKRFAANGYKQSMKFKQKAYEDMNKFANNSYAKLVNFSRQGYNDDVKRANKEMKETIDKWGKESGEFLNGPTKEYIKNVRKQTNEFIRKVTDSHVQDIKDRNASHKETMNYYQKEHDTNKAFEKSSRNEAKLNRRESEYYRRQAATALGDKKAKKIKKAQEKLIQRLSDILGEDLTSYASNKRTNKKRK